MGKTHTYVIMAVTIMLVMTFVGIDNGFSATYKLIGFGYDNTTTQIENVSIGVQSSGMYTKLFGVGVGILAVIGLGLGAIAIGLTTRVQLENLILLPFLVLVLALFVGTFGSIMNSIANGAYPMWLTAVVVTIFLPITVGLVLSLAEWFRGTDQ